MMKSSVLLMMSEWLRAVLVLLVVMFACGWTSLDQSKDSAQGRRAVKGEKRMTKGATDVTFACRHELSTDKLTIHYTVTNQARTDVYLLDLLPSGDIESGQSIVDFNLLYLEWEEPATVFVLKGVPPLPKDMLVHHRITPLGTKLAPGQKLERTFELALPLREQSPYYGALKPEEYKGTKVRKLLLAVEFLRSTAEGFDAKPAPHGADLYVVRSKSIFTQTESLRCEFELPELQLLTRTDWLFR